MSAPCITLTDNGSLRPEATFSLRRLSETLARRTGYPIHPVSLLHSDRISPANLDGDPAQIFEPFVTAKRKDGVHSFLVCPLFFGPSAAIAEFLPQRVEAMREELDWPELEVRVAPCLVDHEQKDDFRVAQMLADLVERKRAAAGLHDSAIALVDHGTPRIAVTHVRNHLAEQLGTLLKNSVRPCSMERREGPEYDFNEPLLERLLGQEGFDRSVIVSMLFLQPGRHAGPGGDVAQICQEAEKRTEGLETHMTDLVGAHPDLIDVLAERLEAVLEDPIDSR